MSEDKISDSSPALPAQRVLFREIDPTPAEPEVLPEWKVAGIFSSNMVLQRGCPITVWGWSSHIGAKVEASWEEETVCSTVGEDGRFEVTFTAREGSFLPTTMTVSSAYGKDIFTNILVGDVWVIGGQSNAELHLERCLSDTPEIAEDLKEDHPFRLFYQDRATAFACKKYYFTPARDIINPQWCWRKPGPDAARSFSALGYYFARLITEQITVPVGVVMMCASGSCLRELMPFELAERQGCPMGANVPAGAYYNTLIAPLVGLQFKGQIFFQGESEGIPHTKNLAMSYDVDLAAFVEDERQRFGVDFSFYNVQLSSYTKKGADFFPYLYWVRGKQFSALKQIPSSYLIVSRDQGSKPEDADPFHSTHKYEIGRRVAAMALAGDYGIGDIESASSPLPISAIRQKDSVQVKFTCTNGGITTVEQNSLVGFSFMDPEGKEILTKAQIVDGDTVSIEIPEGADVSEVHYSMMHIATLQEANLCGGTGLPAPAFILPVHEI